MTPYVVYIISFHEEILNKMFNRIPTTVFFLYFALYHKQSKDKFYTEKTSVRWNFVKHGLWLELESIYLISKSGCIYM